jgi:hypothetical protein
MRDPTLRMRPPPRNGRLAIEGSTVKLAPPLVDTAIFAVALPSFSR